MEFSVTLNGKMGLLLEAFEGKEGLVPEGATGRRGILDVDDGTTSEVRMMVPSQKEEPLHPNPRRLQDGNDMRVVFYGRRRKRWALTDHPKEVIKALRGAEINRQKRKEWAVSQKKGCWPTRKHRNGGCLRYNEDEMAKRGDCMLRVRLLFEEYNTGRSDNGNAAPSVFFRESFEDADGVDGGAAGVRLQISHQAPVPE
ncbi:UNVERIFIED_CONTAM: hypothetical protein PYX00_005834 [Menopon gallinae]|uniref:Uncharacterized protein n=1 Tax=Menopon gallinae TaxID=328185 RepID=A0AAW2HT45_9NEOP